MDAGHAAKETYLLGMPKRTSPQDAVRIEIADDFEDVVQDKRAGWRASSAKARRRQRRYQRLLLSQIATDVLDGDWDRDARND